MFQNKLLAIMLIFFISMISGCIDDGEDSNQTVLPTDNQLNLYCENVGIHPEKCVMDDEENPYRFTSVGEESKWDLGTGFPKTDFYLWATALASTGTGENQIAVAEQLHKLYSLSGSENIRKQAIKAYQAVLDHFFWSSRFIPASWIKDEEVVYGEEILRITVGKRLFGTWIDYDTKEVMNVEGMKLGSQMMLSNLFKTQFHAQEQLNKWGYVFDYDNEVLDPL